MCGLATSEYFRQISLFVALILPLLLALAFGRRSGIKFMFSLVVAGTALFVLPIAGSVFAVNYCSAQVLNDFDTNADGVFGIDEQTNGYAVAESRAVGDGGRNVFALISPAIGLLYVALLLLGTRSATWLFGVFGRPPRGSRSDV